MFWPIVNRIFSVLFFLFVAMQNVSEQRLKGKTTLLPAKPFNANEQEEKGLKERETRDQKAK